MRTLLFVLTFLLIAGCSNDETSSSDVEAMKISPTEYTKRETLLIEGLSGQEVLGYDVSAIPSGHLFHIIVEHYHDGVKQENVAESADTILDDQELKSILLTREKTDKTFSVKALTYYGDGYNRMASNGEYEEANSSAIFEKLEEEVTFKLNEQVIIGMTIEDDGDELTSGVLQEDDPRFQESISKYQDVFVYKIFVSKE
ncbi:hypothetical protein [Metabacillus rhizolycopersici]|uniref:Lipoprotein n=1 Tax=Metabacillus rhizolycopersici TaxID=2875709 RepID=A0ABS7UN35_9BACI|nr:hypothetical protein [Metabacillus rhizolycopersici]MBZ5749716.1 hypothetical protein [Metabacillus rhizolycopersici]